MDIRILRYFLAVAEKENITRAAEFLHIAQPSLSKQLIDLENELGKKLFIRGKRKITLTDEGILLRKRAEEIVSLLEKTERELAADSDQVSGEVAIGGGQSKLVVQAASQTVENYPEIHFYWYSGDAEEVMEKLEHGTLDFGVLLEPIDILKYESLPLPTKEHWGLLMRRDSPLAQNSTIEKTDIEHAPLIVPHRAGLQRKLAKWFGTEPERLNITATFNLIYSTPSLLVENQLGYAVTRDCLIHIEENSHLCFRPFFPTMETNAAIVWKRHQPLSKAAAKFIEVLNRCIEGTSTQ